ncbi:DUF6349 family protein [Kitasatospora sp. NPDC015120]|uniref:DUF6349 family protein n=1 Tax=Kitasatospora sp. NPDC015120 TaxID=3364023 RepID=UPI0036F49A89
MTTLADLRELIAARTDHKSDPDRPAAGYLLWDTLIAAGITPSINLSSAGRAISIDLPDGTSIWVTEQADVSHHPDDHEAWTALHHYDPADPLGPYHLIYEGPRNLGHTADTAACVDAISAWITAHTAVGALARHNAYVALPKGVPRDARRASWMIGYAKPGFNGRHPTTPTTRHTPTHLDRHLNTHTERRGACLACNWEGPARRHQNAAIEDALDHTHPGWRDLPTLPQSVGGRNATLLRAYRDATFPPGWFDTGGPLKVWTTTANDWHEHSKAPGGGYLIKVHRPAPAPAAHQQQTLL